MGLLPVTLHQLSKSTSFRAPDFSTQQQPIDESKPGVPSSKWWSLLCQPKYITCAVVVFGLTFVSLSSFNDPLVYRVSASFKIRLQTEGSSGKGTDVAACDLLRNSPGNVTSDAESTDDRAREACYATQKGEAIPRGMIVATTDLQMRSLIEQDEQNVQKAMPKNLLAMAVGIKQKQLVDDIVHKFPLTNFTIMLFHYDGVVDQWRDLAWSNQSIHVVALHQTKWWFAKRFMHPDIVDQYDYIFLWDEDLGVQHFHAQRYLEVMEAESLEISQPALDPDSLEIHHTITRRRPLLTAHKSIVSQSCSADNKAVPCTGFVEVMAPVFSRAAWRCVWHMIQNDLVHGWGIDLKIGYCAQGLRSEKVGVVDAEYVLHKGIPSLGGQTHVNKTILAQQHDSNSAKVHDPRKEVRRKSSKELLTFQRRWARAATDDSTWEDPYKAYAEAERYHSKARPPPAVPTH